MAGGRGPNWDGLLKWSLSYSDAARSTSRLSEEDQRWFMEALQAHTIDAIRRMKEISQIMKIPEEVLDAQGITPQDFEGVLEELQEHVESIDTANDLHSIGGLVPLLGHLRSSHANIRAKAADVVATIVQNNPQSQKLVMEANGFEPLLANFVSDIDVTVRTKSLGAISSLIRHNRSGIAAFRLANGYGALRDALATDNLRFQRKALNLIQYLLHETNSDRSIVSEMGFPRLMIHLASNEDIEVREFSLRCLFELARDRFDGNSGNLLEKSDEKLRQLLQGRIEMISSMSREDLEAVREERQLVDSLWKICYNEPSTLGERGLLVLPEEDTPPPDVASSHFEPPLRRAWAVRRNNDASSSSEAKKPLLLGPAPSR